jgi:GNAT superfamily N-acetyltransferase
VLQERRVARRRHRRDHAVRVAARSDAATERGYTIERCGDALATEVRDFQTRMLGARSRQVDPARWNWLTASNPQRTDDGCPVWIARDDDAVVGVLGAIPFELEVAGAACSASWAIDVMVDPLHRGRGIGTALVRAHQRSCRIALAFGLSDGGYATFRRAGESYVGTASSHAFACDPRIVASTARHSPTRAAIARSVSTAPIAGLRALARLRAGRIELVAIDAFDEGVDRVWRDVSPFYRVVARRDATWARWRFDQSPDADGYRRYYVVHRGRMIGYVVFRASVWRDLPALEILDYFVRPRDVGRLFALAIRLARREGNATVLCTTLNTRAERTLRLMGFLKRKNAGATFRVTAYTDDGDPVREALHQRDGYFLTRADSDVDD